MVNGDVGLTAMCRRGINLRRGRTTENCTAETQSNALGIMVVVLVAIAPQRLHSKSIQHDRWRCSPICHLFIDAVLSKKMKSLRFCESSALVLELLTASPFVHRQLYVPVSCDLQTEQF
jgi:hypothetical protein